MTILHFVTASVFPMPGGAGTAILRIAKHFQANSNYRCIIYTRSQSPEQRYPAAAHGDIEVVHLASRKELLMAPRGDLARSPETLPNEYLLHAFQIDLQLLLQEVGERLAQHSEARHLLISFTATSTGFVAQHVALRLGLPHICSFRGSDFSRDFASPFHIAPIQFVVERADRIVTTNQEQARQLARAFPRANAFQTIYNAVEWPNGLPQHEPPPPAPIRLISDCEFSLKKATHLLMQAAAALHDEGWPVTLDLPGRSSNFEDDYWDATKRTYSQRYPGVFSFPGRLTASQVAGRLQRSHIYCSATLSEGCSHGRIQALTMGLPIVTTRCGALAEVAGDCRHIHYARPGDFPGFVDPLRSMMGAVQDGSLEIDQACVDSARRLLSPAREARDWKVAVETVLAAAG